MQTSKTAYSRKSILLRGVIINPYSPSTALLSVTLDVTGLFTSEEYMAWKEGLEDKLNALDAKYAKAEKRLRGRSLKASYKTVKTDRLRVLTFEPYPSRFSNTLGNVRAQLYGSEYEVGVIESHALILSEEHRGRMVKKTYLVPHGEVTPLYDDMEPLNKTIEETQSEIDGYEQTEDFKNLVKYVEDKIPAERWSKQPGSLHSKLHPITLNPKPIELSPTLYEEYLDDRVKTEFQKQIRSSATALMMDFQKRLTKHLEKLTECLSQEIHAKTLTSIQKHLGEIRRLAQSGGVYDLLNVKFEATEALIKAIREKEPDQIKDAIRIIAQVTDTPLEENPEHTLRQSIDKLNSEIDPATKALIIQIT